MKCGKGKKMPVTWKRTVAEQRWWGAHPPPEKRPPPSPCSPTAAGSAASTLSPQTLHRRSNKITIGGNTHASIRLKMQRKGTEIRIPYRRQPIVRRKWPSVSDPAARSRSTTTEIEGNRRRREMEVSGEALGLGFEDFVSVFRRGRESRV